MTDHEKEILDKIKQSTEKTPVPESLAPDLLAWQPVLNQTRQTRRRATREAEDRRAPTSTTF